MSFHQNTLEYYFRNVDAWDSMYRDCENARHSIDMEQYILIDDEAGHRFLELFLKKAQEGVKVRLVFDGIGCRGLRGSCKILDDIRAAGGLVHFYNALWWHHIFYPARWTPRTHIKTLLVDEKIAYTGSACIWHLMRDWHELQVRFTGPVVEQVVKHMARRWVSRSERHRLRHGPQVPDTEELRYVVSEPHFGHSPLYRELLARIKKAKKRIRIVTPYFLPPRRLQKALRQAAARGVKVEVLLSERTDVPIADHVSRTYYPSLLKGGVRIFLYGQGVLHAKYALVDDEWATMGSLNMDYLSLTRNREANLIVRDKDVAGTLWDKSTEYIRDSSVVTPDFWAAIRPHYKMFGYLGRCMKEIL